MFTSNSVTIHAESFIFSMPSNRARKSSWGDWWRFRYHCLKYFDLSSKGGPSWIFARDWSEIFYLEFKVNCIKFEKSVKSRLSNESNFHLETQWWLCFLFGWWSRPVPVFHLQRRIQQTCTLTKIQLSVINTLALIRPIDFIAPEILNVFLFCDPQVRRAPCVLQRSSECFNQRAILFQFPSPATPHTLILEIKF